VLPVVSGGSGGALEAQPLINKTKGRSGSWRY